MNLYTVNNRLDLSEINLDENDHESSFVSLYSKMMEQYHENQGQISDAEMDKLNAEFAQWQKKTEMKMDATQEAINVTNAKIEATRKVKSQLDKVNTYLMGFLHKTKSFSYFETSYKFELDSLLLEVSLQ